MTITLDDALVITLYLALIILIIILIVLFSMDINVLNYL